MKKRILVACFTIMIAAFSRDQIATGLQRQSSGSVQQNASAQRALLDQYCVTCHNEKVKTGLLVLDSADITHVSQSPELWEKVVRKLRAGMMPPSGAKR